MTISTPLQYAAHVYQHRRSYDRAGLDAAIAGLGVKGFSGRQIASITGADPRRVAKVTGNRNAERKGGRLNPDTLAAMLEAQRDYIAGADHSHAMSTVLQMGTSQYVAADLTGIPRHLLLRGRPCTGGARHRFAYAGEPGTSAPTCQRSGCDAINPAYRPDDDTKREAA